MEGKAKQWQREAFHSSHCCCWTMAGLPAGFAGSLPCYPRKMRFLNGLFLFLLSFPFVLQQPQLWLSSRAYPCFPTASCFSFWYLPAWKSFSFWKEWSAVHLPWLPWTIFLPLEWLIFFHRVIWGFRNIYVLVSWYTCAADGVEKWWGMCVGQFSRK